MARYRTTNTGATYCGMLHSVTTLSITESQRQKMGSMTERDWARLRLCDKLRTMPGMTVAELIEFFAFRSELLADARGRPTSSWFILNELDELLANMLMHKFIEYVPTAPSAKRP